jgi:CHAT domain-containing protein/tetratricopeptide (TPR) repeat protein
MASGPRAHLTPEETERLLSAVFDSDHPSTGDEEEVRAHLAVCDICTKRMDRLCSAHLQLKQLAKDTSSATEGCLDESQWLEVAAGLWDRHETVVHLAHAGTCRRCATLLHEAMQDLGLEMATAQTSLHQKTESLPLPQSSLSQRLISQREIGLIESRRMRAKGGFGFWQIAALAATLICAVGATWYLWPRPQLDPEALLARAYAEQRTVDFRIPGGQDVPERRERGGTFDLRNTAFLEARTAIAKQLEAHPGDPGSLRQSATADLLEWKYASALETLDRLSAESQTLPPVKAIRGAALLEQWETESNDADLFAAASSFKEAADAAPKDPVILYNYELVLEKQQLYSDALKACEGYLVIDPSGPWSDEIRRRRTILEQKVKDRQHPQRSQEVPDGISDVHGQLNFIEAVLAGKGSRTLSRAWSDGVEMTWEKHHDAWPKSFITETQLWTHGKQEAVTSLHSAIMDNLAGDSAHSIDNARRAMMAFGASHSSAGQLRAQLELVIALRRTEHVKDCATESVKLASALREQRTDFSWIYARTTLEEATCRGRLEQYAAMQFLLAKARSTVSTNQYFDIEQRVVQLTASADFVFGHTESSITQSFAGIALCAAHHLDPIQFFTFYEQLAMIAEREDDWPLAYDYNREAAESIVDIADQAAWANAQLQFAKAAIAIGKAEEGRALIHEVADRLPALQSNPSLYGEINVWMARAAIASNEYPTASEYLTTAAPLVHSSGNALSGLLFEKTLGELLVDQKRTRDAKTHLQQAQLQVESHLRDLKDYEERLMWLKEIGDIYRLQAEADLDENDTPGAFAIWERYKALLSDSTPPTQFEMRETRPERILISWVSRESRTLEFIRHPDGTISSGASIVPRQQLLQLQHIFLGQLSHPYTPLPAIQSTGARLFQALLGPLAQQMPASASVILQPDEELGDIPFAALVGPDAEYLGRHYEFATSPFIAMNVLVAGHVGRNDKVLVLSSSDSLGNSDTEPDELRTLFPESIILEGRDAELPRIRKALITASVLHFTGHSFSQSGKQLLLIGKGHSLQATDLIGSSHAHLQLAVLAGCSTARSRGEMRDPHSWVGSLLRSGVPDLIASRWPVDSASTSSFMRSFYTTLLRGESVPTALQRAASQVSANTATAHPYYWASFDVFETQ